MRFALPLVLAGLSLAVAPVACGGNVSNASSGSGSGGSGATGPAGTGGASIASSTTGGPSETVSSTVSTTGPATVAASSSTGPWMTEAPFPAAPQVQSYGGQVLASPNIYGIFFASDDPTLSASLADFTKNIGSTSYWTGAVSEYGVGPATAQIITLSETPATNLTDQQIQTWLTGKFGTDPNFPATPGPNDIYIIYYPSGVSIDLFGNPSCQSFGGYHDEASFNGTPVAYAVLPRCSYPGASLLDVATGSASHELLEAATDPYPQSNPAYTLPDDADIFLVDALGGGEIGDMCAQQPQAFTTFPGFNYVVQRVWSNQAAAAGHDPCQPQPAGEVYYNAAPVFSGNVTYTIQGQKVPVHGIKIAVGKSATIPVDFYSDGPMNAWPAKAYDYQSTFMGGSPLLTLNLTPATGNNGTVGSLDITVNKAGLNNQEVFFIASSTDGGATVNWWFGVVTN